MDQQNQFCIDCKHCIKEGAPIPGVSCMVLKCECVGLRDVVTGNVTYQLCDRARYLINNNKPNSPTCDYFEKKEKLSFRQRIKRFFCGE